MTDDAQTDADRAVTALYDFLLQYFVTHRIPWMHGRLGDDRARGRAHALTELVLLPELRQAFDAIDARRDQEGGFVQFPLGPTLEKWHPEFESDAG